MGRRQRVDLPQCYSWLWSAMPRSLVAKRDECFLSLVAGRRSLLDDRPPLIRRRPENPSGEQK